MKLKQDENGNTIFVDETTQTTETPFGSDEIKRQIAQHSEIIQNLQKQLQAVEEFEGNANMEQEMVVSDVIAKPIIDEVVLQEMISAKEITLEYRGEVSEIITLENKSDESAIKPRRDL